MVHANGRSFVPRNVYLHLQLPTSDGDNQLGQTITNNNYNKYTNYLTYIILSYRLLISKI